VARGAPGFWVELTGLPRAQLERAGAQVGPIVSALLESEWHRSRVTEELTSRYEEIDLLYTITDILGSTVGLEQAAGTIVREVASVVGARRASIMVADEDGRELRTIAARGFTPDEAFRVAVDDPGSIAARVFRERRVLAHDPAPGDSATTQGDRPYRGHAWLSVPICHAAPGGPLRCIGVMNLTDRIGGDRFTAGDRKLLSAIASQIGSAIETARLAAHDRQRQRLNRELELAHDLQLRLLPAPSVLAGEAEVAAECRPVESVGGDFYTFSRLGQGRVGVMLGDVSSHGFAAALVMALILKAAGIHVDAASSPEATVRALLESMGEELQRTEMYFTVFYGVLDPPARRMRYVSAGHAHAFRVPQSGPAVRLEATVPPLGLVAESSIMALDVNWLPGADLLCLWTDGMVDAVDASGERFGEARLLDLVSRLRDRPVQEILEAVFAAQEAWAWAPSDDRTLLILRI
jgi:sigma-B regulation protein RsbU (phosphoserine phosphatase)